MFFFLVFVFGRDFLGILYEGDVEEVLEVVGVLYLIFIKEFDFEDVKFLCFFEWRVKFIISLVFVLDFIIFCSLFLLKFGFFKYMFIDFLDRIFGGG